jgi:rare lipoprotein A
MIKTRTAARLAVCAFAFAGIFAAAPLAADSEIIRDEATASFYADEFNGRPTSSGEIFDMNAFTAAHKTLPFGTMLVVTNLDNGKKTVVRVNDRGPFVEDRELDVSKGAAQALDMITSGTARVSIVKVDGPELAAAQTEAGQPQTSAQAETASTTPAETTAESGASATAASAVAYETTASAPAGTAPAATTAITTASAVTATTASPALATTAQNTAKSTWRIQLGAFAREDNALKLVAKLRKDGFQPAFEKTAGLTRVVIPGVADSGLSAIKDKLAKSGYADFIVRKEAW